MHKKKIVFLSGTRADFGKLKPLIEAVNLEENFEVHLFVTGMHLLPQYGSTVHEILKCGYENVYMYNNTTSGQEMDVSLANTIDGLSHYVRELKPDMIVVHGDRPEALAGAIVGSFNNIIVAHIEGGELSGTIDGLIRHSITKLAHVHFVANRPAKRRLLQKASVFTINSSLLRSTKFFCKSIFQNLFPHKAFINPLELCPFPKSDVRTGSVFKCITSFIALCIFTLSSSQ